MFVIFGFGVWILLCFVFRFGCASGLVLLCVLLVDLVLLNYRDFVFVCLGDFWTVLLVVWVL